VPKIIAAFTNSTVLGRGNMCQYHRKWGPVKALRY